VTFLLAQKVGTASATQTITLTNNMTTTVNFTSITKTGDYQEKNSCGTSLAAGGTCTVTVRFTPKTTGTRTGTVTINNDAPGSPEIVTLTGTGQ